MTDPQNAAASLPWQAPSATLPRKTALLPLLIVVAAVLAAWFGTLDLRHLLRSDEGRYAEIAREMWASGDWVTIRYHELKYFEKPPLHLWMTALAYELFGLGEWQARLWVALGGAFGIALCVLAGHKLYGAGLLAGLVLLATPSWNIGSHFNSLDMGVSAALTAVLVCTLVAQRPQVQPRERRGWMWAAWAAMALAVLGKGLIGIVLPGLALIVYTLVARDWVLWKRLYLVSGTLIFLAIAAPWFVLVSLRNPEFPQFFFIHEHFQRYTSSVHQRGAPAWYFVPQWLGGFLPWLALLPGMWKVVRDEARGAAAASQSFRPLLLCVVWAVAIFVFFSASGSKLPGYILPVFPALAVLGGAALQQMTLPQWRWHLLALAVIATLGLGATLFVGRGGDEAAALLRVYGRWLAAACVLALLGLAVAAWMWRRGELRASITAYALAAFAATTVGLLGHETLGRPASGADLVPTINAVLKPGMPIYSVRLLDHTLPFYLRRTTAMVEEPDELAFGVQQEPAKWLPTLAAFQQVWASGPPALAIMAPRQFNELQAQGLPMNPVARDARRVVVANFPVVPARP